MECSKEGVAASARYARSATGDVPVVERSRNDNNTAVVERSRNDLRITAGASAHFVPSATGMYCSLSERSESKGRSLSEAETTTTLRSLSAAETTTTLRRALRLTSFAQRPTTVSRETSGANARLATLAQRPGMYCSPSERSESRSRSLSAAETTTTPRSLSAAETTSESPRTLRLAVLTQRTTPVSRETSTPGQWVSAQRPPWSPFHERPARAPPVGPRPRSRPEHPRCRDASAASLRP